MSEIVYLSLGSNLGDREANLSEALEQLRRHGEIRAISSLYETEPVEVTDQPWFLNCAAAIETRLSPDQLLDEALNIEKALGRRRTQNKGPRLIDIDILLFGQHVIDEPGLRIPHPAMAERRFVLDPLNEIAPGVIHPTLHRTIRELRQDLPESSASSRPYSGKSA